MEKNKITLDRFRVIAAILIIAIHTYPFESINENLDFIFTHVICRIGVPFFLMITGFFVLPKALENRKSLINYTIKIAKVYVLCMILYLPVSLYAGKLNHLSAVQILKDVFLNGTFYHLWYFPALIFGIWIVYFLLKHCNKKVVGVCVLLLYMIGLFGDSYFGISEKWIVTSTFYNGIFSIFDYTRNGLFYAPIFLSLGYMFNQVKWNLSKQMNLTYILLFLIAMIVEGFILHSFHLQKHDSMYLMLIPLMANLFYFILQGNGENNKKLRSISTMIYIIHPLFIIVVRGIAKVLHLQNIMVANSLIHYLLVVGFSVGFSILWEMLKEKWMERKLHRDENN